jgi:cytochrome c oxidase subunit 2
MVKDRSAPSAVRAARPGSGSRARGRGGRSAVALLGLLLAGCGVGNDQSTLDPAASPARRISDLWWLMFIGGTVIFAVVVMLLLAAIVRGRGRPEDAPSRSPAGNRLVVLGGAVVPAIVLVALFALAVRTMPSTAASRAKDARLTIQVIGRQWFWQVRYPGLRITTANEIHIPVGQPVAVQVATADVLHSFWVPELNRKIDTIPGQRNVITLKAERAGVFAGQCAEFCGLQHAHMQFLVIADPPAVFAQWAAAQQRPAPAPTSAAAARGQAVFDTTTCAACHTVAGTPASGDAGPDLTHVAGRRMLAAGAIMNTPSDLGAWVRDPQHIKPGVKMPPTELSPNQLRDLLTYLGTLR